MGVAHPVYTYYTMHAAAVRSKVEEAQWDQNLKGPRWLNFFPSRVTKDTIIGHNIVVYRTRARVTLENDSFPIIQNPADRAAL